MPYYYDFLKDKNLEELDNIELRKSTFIYKELKDNLICYDEEDQNLLNAIKKYKRESNRLNSDKSEDAVTWNVFRSIEKSKKADELLSKILSIEISNSKIMYWSYDVSENGIFTLLSKARTSCNESKRSPTEPDLIIECDQAIISIEAKFTSSNNVYCNSDRVLSKYESNDVFNDLFKEDMKTISKKEGHKKYELARNWIIGHYMHKYANKKFILINLVREEAEGNIEEIMRKIIKEDSNHIFRRLTWENIYYVIRDYPELRELKMYFEGKTAGLSNDKVIKAFNI